MACSVISPLSLSPTVWYKADAGTNQTAGGTPATADGDPVGEWVDQSGNVNNEEQATAGKRPLIKLSIQNLPVIRFDGTDDVMSSSAFGSSLTAPYTLFFAFSQASGASTFVFSGLSDANGLGKSGPNWDYSISVDTQCGASDTSFHVAMFMINGASSKYRFDGGSETTFSPGAANLTGITLGAFHTSLFGGCDWGECIVYSGDLSAANDDAIFAYLKSRWGVPFDAASNSGYQAAASTYSWTHTCTGVDRFLAVDVSLLSAGSTVTGITYNGVNLTFIGAQSTVTSFGRVESWGLAAPTAGANTIAVTLSGSIASVACAASYNDVHQTSPTEAYNSAQATNAGAADATVTVTTVTDNCVVHGAIATDDVTITANLTSRNNVSQTGVGSGANEDTNTKLTPAGAQVVSYSNVSTLKTWAIGGYGIRPCSAPSLFSGGYDAYFPTTTQPLGKMIAF